MNQSQMNVELDAMKLLNRAADFLLESQGLKEMGPTFRDEYEESQEIGEDIMNFFDVVMEEKKQ